MAVSSAFIFMLSLMKLFGSHGCDTVIASRDFAKLQTSAYKLQNATGRKCLPVAMDVRKVIFVEMFNTYSQH